MPPSLDLLGLELEGNQLIEASAGTGKTWTNCALVLRLLVERGLRVREILVVTFTKAATAELKARIRARLVDMRRVIARMTNGSSPSVLCPPSSARCVADAFASRYAEEIRAGRVPGVDAQQARHAVDRALAEFDEAAIFTIHGFCQRALAEVPFAAGLPFAFEVAEDDAEWLERAAADFFRSRIASAEFEPAVVRALRSSASPEVLARALKARLGRPLAELRFAGARDPGRFRDYARAYEAARVERNGVRHDIFIVSDPISAWDKLLASPFASLPARDMTALRRLVRIPRKGESAAAAPQPFLDAARVLLDLVDPAREDLERLRIGLLEEFLREAPGRVRGQKREQRVIAYDDMLYNLHQALHDPKLPWLAGALAARYPAALIDEFQDTDALQYAIFSTLYAQPGAALFLVGDPKQSIYAFRNADLHTYLDAARHAGAERTHTLGANQRCVPGHIAATNALFGANPRAFVLPEVGFHPAVPGERSHPALRDDGNDSQLTLWMLPGNEDAPLSAGVADSAVVRATVGEIARLIAGGNARRITIGDRPLAARDIAVIVRTHDQAARMRAALRDAGIGSVERGEHSVFATDEAETISLLLACLADAGDAGVRRAVLATPLVGLDAAAIEREAADDAASARRAAQFAAYRDLWRDRGFSAMWRRLLDDAGTAARLLSGREGERALTNLLHLAELLQEAAQRLSGIDEVQRWYERQRADSPKAEAALLRLESDEDRVELVTVHAAKGLEYPVVFCPFLWRPEASHTREGIEFHEGSRTVVSFAVEDREAQARAELEAFAESVRLIYVAATRAVQRSYLVAGNYFYRRSGNACRRSALNWLVAGAGRTPEDWLDAGADGLAAIESAWRALAAAGAPAMTLSSLPDGLPVPVATAVEASERKARIARRQLSESWRLASFTSLISDARSERQSAADHDESIEIKINGVRHDKNIVSDPIYPQEHDAAPGPDDPLRLPRGAAAGSLLHAVFERADFTDPASWEDAIDAALRRFPPGAQSAEHCAAGEPLRAVLRQTLRAVPATDLDGEGSRLAQVDGRSRLNEVEFDFGTGVLDAGLLAQAIRFAGFPDTRLAFEPLKGFLRGAIDCVLHRRGRFFLIDWKSNFLGWRPDDYHPGRLDQAMAEEGYGLQAAIYAVALHRYLRRRIRAYDCGRDFGGILYLFVRGIRPGWSDARGRPAGVFRLRPGADALERLDRAFGGAPAAETGS